METYVINMLWHSGVAHSSHRPQDHWLQFQYGTPMASLIWYVIMDIFKAIYPENISLLHVLRTSVSHMGHLPMLCDGNIFSMWGDFFQTGHAGLMGQYLPPSIGIWNHSPNHVSHIWSPCREPCCHHIWPTLFQVFRNRGGVGVICSVCANSFINHPPCGRADSRTGTYMTPRIHFQFKSQESVHWPHILYVCGTCTI